ncbi:uncharacterized protein EMH_0021160 [Eimeria mitis]|uniref:Uncharacterized protein n=1 Tax=Eimeria mitis TaxID=44415 RepID=U6KGJ3_9EIME|nr:uncharacterized protein EMH_0021160 [Eimeria mitis]CDJ34588.1 hypothetical protein EMH_0021160 [Eimeria mitis]
MAAVQTTIKTELCSFSEYRIYPESPRLIACLWVASKVWRRANKKSRGESVAKRRTRKGAKVQKAIVGISLEEIKQKRATKPDASKMRKMPAKEKDKKEKKEKPKASVIPGARAAPAKMIPRQKMTASRLM